MQRTLLSLAAVVLFFLSTTVSVEAMSAAEISPKITRGPTATPLFEESSAKSPAGLACPTALGAEGHYLREVTARTAISPSAEQALDIVPGWLRMDLYDAFLRMEASQQEDYGQLILGLKDERVIDEVAFVVAHSSCEVLAHSDPALYARNAELLYQIDPQIPYADIIDYGEPGVDADYYSTVRYRTIRDGKMGEYDLPVEIYYWYVVHPKLGDENPSMSPTLTDRTSTYGYLWREYLFYNPSQEFDYSLYFVTKTPNRVQQEDLEGWGPGATGYLTDAQRKCPDGIVICGGDSAKPALVEFAWGYSRVIVTTLEVETAYAAGHRRLLENLVMRSSGFPQELLIPKGQRDSDFVAIVDDTHDAKVVGPIEEVLQNNRIDYELHSSDELRLPLWSQFTKIIFASHQPRTFYERLSEEPVLERLRNWMSDMAGTFEFHGACDAQASWADLEMPFRLGYVAERFDEVTLCRYPVLGDVIRLATHYWDDSVVNASLPSFRPFEPDSMAVDIITNWVSRMLPFSARGNRPIQPNQICYEHNGNCGEIQDLINAAARTCLIPSAGVNNWTWDHVTCEFWDNGWHGYQVGWNVGSASIANQGVLSDKDFGGGKDLSAIEQDRGDTFPVNATARYSKVCHFHASVRDRNENPVDGARIRTYVRYFNKPSGQLVSPIWAYTDSSGQVVMDLGNNRDFWFIVTSKAGDTSLEKLLTETVEDTDYYHSWNVSGQVPQLPPITPIDFPDSADNALKLSVCFNVDYETLYSLSGRTFAYKEQSGNVDFFIVSSDEFYKYRRGEPFSAYEWRQDSQGDDFEVMIPADQAYFIVFSNQDTITVKEFVTLTLQAFQKQGAEWVPIEAFENFVGIPAQKAYVVAFNNTRPPQIYAAGFLDAEVNSEEGFTLTVRACVADPDGPGDVDDVQLCYGGIPLDMHLRDDGRSPDAAAGDGIFTYSQVCLPQTVTPGLYRLEIIATDIAGNSSTRWPFIRVLSEPLRLPQHSKTVKVSTSRPANDADGAPVILAGGFFGTDAVQPGQLMQMIVWVDDPDGLFDITRVELFLEGQVPTGLIFNDDGINGDQVAGDGFFTLQTLVPSGLPAGDLTLEVVAFDASGNRSATFPYLTVN